MFLKYLRGQNYIRQLFFILVISEFSAHTMLLFRLTFLIRPILVHERKKNPSRLVQDFELPCLPWIALVCLKTFGLLPISNSLVFFFFLPVWIKNNIRHFEILLIIFFLNHQKCHFSWAVKQPLQVSFFLKKFKERIIELRVEKDPKGGIDFIPVPIIMIDFSIHTRNCYSYIFMFFILKI